MPTEGTKICFSYFTLLEWNVKNCFVNLIHLDSSNLNYLRVSSIYIFTLYSDFIPKHTSIEHSQIFMALQITSFINHIINAIHHCKYLPCFIP